MMRPLIDNARNGFLDEGLFLDMATFAFEKLVRGASEETVSRQDAYLAHKIKEFADVDAEGSNTLIAAQLVAEALSTQACGGWHKEDGVVLNDRLAVFANGKWVLVDMSPCDLSPLLECLHATLVQGRRAK